MTATLDAALDYAREGLRVLPLHEATEGRCSCPRGADCESPGKHPRIEWKGLRPADEGTIRGWWSRWSTANVGVLTGDGFAVLDVDPRNGGDRALEELEGYHGHVPATRKVATGGGGWHYWLRVPADTRSRVIAPGIELKAAGALVVAPPSIHASGREYAWL